MSKAANALSAVRFRGAGWKTKIRRTPRNAASEQANERHISRVVRPALQLAAAKCNPLASRRSAAKLFVCFGVDEEVNLNLWGFYLGICIPSGNLKAFFDFLQKEYT